MRSPVAVRAEDKRSVVLGESGTSFRTTFYMAKMYQGQPSIQYWEATQKVLQGDIPLVRRPRLTEALLKKPPFRFLHDIISEVCRQTGFARGLFNQEEQISSNMKDKESKVAYLRKIVNCVGITLNAYVPARPLKIVSGMEPEQTNVFLQMLAAATTVDSPARQRAVSRVLYGEKMPTVEQGTMEWTHLYFLLSGCVLPGMKEGGVETHRNTEGTVAASLLGITSQHPTPADEYLGLKSVQQSLPSTRGSSKGALTPSGASRWPGEEFAIEGDIEPLMTLTPTDEAWPPPVQAPCDTNLKNSGEKRGAPHQHMFDIPPSTARTETFRASARPMTIGGDGRASYNAWTGSSDKLGGFPPFATRPQSARHGPPKIHNSVVTAEMAPPKNSAASPPEIVSSLMGGSGSGTEMCSRRRPSIFLDTEVPEDDESDALFVVVPAEQHLRKTLTSAVAAGKLSESIAAPSEDLENAVSRTYHSKYDVDRAEDDSETKQDMIFSSIVETKEDAKTKQEVVQGLRVMVQSLCQATNPLRKSIDYLQEDEEAMDKEHQFWIKERSIYSARLDEEKRITDEMLQAEAGRILELEEEAHHYHHRITSAKAQASTTYSTQHS